MLNRVTPSFSISYFIQTNLCAAQLSFNEHQKVKFLIASLLKHGKAHE